MTKDVNRCSINRTSHINSSIGYQSLWPMTEFQLLDIWSKFHRNVIVSYYTDSSTCSNESGETEHSTQGMEISWKLKICFTAHALSHLTHLAPEYVTTNDTCGGQVCFYRPRPPTLYTVCQQLAAIQQTIWLAEVGWQVMAQAFKWPGRAGGSASLYVLPGWVKQTTEFITSQSPGTKFTFPHSAIYIACLAYISQSLKQNKYL